MAYRLYYGSGALFDSITDNVVYDAKLTTKTNTSDYLDFTVPYGHDLYGDLAVKAETVKLYWDKDCLYVGTIESIETDLEGNLSITCTGALDWLADTVIRPYSTIAGEQPLTAPTSVDGLFEWYVKQHNKHCMDSRKQFAVGVNQGSLLDENNYVYRESEQLPTTLDEIQDKIIDDLGGYLFVRYEPLTIDLYADVHTTNAQIIDFGVNITDFSSTTDTFDQYTAIRPKGTSSDSITIETLPDGRTGYNADMWKSGDVVYSISGVSRYGYREYAYSNDNCETAEGLLTSACKMLMALLSPQLSITVKAVDLALYMDGYTHLKVGEAVRVRSKFHGVDEYVMVRSIDLDLQDPSQSTYELGAEYSTLTGQQSSYLKSLNAGINKSLDSVSALDQVTKDAAKDAKAASEKADQAAQDASDAASKADEAKTDAANASTKADQASTDAKDAADKATEANESAKKAQEDAANAISNAKTAVDAAADASKKADDNTAKISVVENTIKTISGDTSTAIANAKAAQDAADAAKKAADQAQADATTANTEIGKVQSQVESINQEIGDVKQEASDLRDDLSGQITTVKNTMEADYARKTDLSTTESTLRNEITESAAGVIRTVSQDYATKTELATTTEATNKNTTDLTNAINKFNSDVDNLQGQIDGAIETWFYEVDPTASNEPAKNWTTDALKKVHLGDLYYNTKTGYCWRYQLQNGSYSWSRITDVDVTKALADAAAAQTTANSKKRVFVAAPTPPYDIGDLWVQGSNGDIMRCQTAKSSSQSYAAADWVKASKYTDDTATTALSNYVEKTYSTKSEVTQLSDQVSSVVSSVETIKLNVEAAQTSADNAKKAADAAQSTADTAKTNAATAQSKADEAAKNLATAEASLKNLQSQADATDEQVAAAKAEVEKAKTAAANAQADATAANTAASTAQATADIAKTNAKKAQDDVDTLKNRVTTAETSIKQNSEAIALRATKTEVTSAIDNISVGGKNLLSDTGTSHTITGANKKNQCSGDYKLVVGSAGKLPSGEYTCQGDIVGTVAGGTAKLQWNGTPWKNTSNVITVSSSTQHVKSTFTLTADTSYAATGIQVRLDNVSGTVTLSNLKLEKGNKPTDWSPAPEDLKKDATTKADNALTSAKSYTDSQLKITSESITSTVSKTYATKDDLSTTNSNVGKAQTSADNANTAASTAQATADGVKKDLSDNYTTTVDMNSKIEQTANSIKSEVSETYQPKGDYATNSSVKSAIEQSASSITSTVSKTYATKDDLSTTNSNVGKAQTSADNANTAASTAQATADGVTTRVASAETKIEQNAEAIELRATKTEVSTVKSTADSASTNASSALSKSTTLETLIRQSGDGVEVAKKVNGEYTSTKTLLSDDGVHIQDQNDNDLASFTESKIQLGKNSRDSVIEMCNGNGRIKSAQTHYIQLESDGYSAIQSSQDNGVYRGFANMFVQAFPTDQNCYSHAILRAASTETNLTTEYQGGQLSVVSGRTENTSFSNIEAIADNFVIGDMQNVSTGRIPAEQFISKIPVYSGTSGIWTFVKYSDGTAECWGVNSVYTNISSSWYDLYESGVFPNIAYPFTFTSKPVISVGLVGNDTANSGFIEISGDGNGSQTPRLWVLRTDQVTVYQTWSLGIIAKGRWK